MRYSYKDYMGKAYKIKGNSTFHTSETTEIGPEAESAGHPLSAKFVSNTVAVVNESAQATSPTSEYGTMLLINFQEYITLTRTPE